MPKKDDQLVHYESLKDLVLLGQIRNPRNPLDGLVGARFTMTVKKPKESES